MYREGVKKSQKHENFMPEHFFMSETTRKQLTTPAMTTQTIATAPNRQNQDPEKRFFFLKKWSFGGLQFGDPAHMLEGSQVAG